MTTKNAKTLPKVYYGLHFSTGVAEYREPNKEPRRILINENAAKAMDATFPGRPVYVGHVDEVDLANIQHEADGYVLESFYNRLDGKHWAKFIVVSDAGHEAIRRGWTLSNAYVPKSFGSGGEWHGVSYSQEVLSGEYEHLAIVNDPRYAESLILTPEEFKTYNEKRETELKRLANSKEKGEPMFKLFNRTKVETSKATDLENTVVELPKSKKEMTIAEALNGYDTVLNMHGYANDDHMVKVGENEMSVKKLKKDYEDCMNELTEMKKPKEENEGDMDESMENAEDDEEDKDKKKDKKENEEDDKEDDKDEKPKKNKAKKNSKSDEEARRDKEHFEKLKNAREESAELASSTIMLDCDRVEVGKKRYG